MPLPLATMVALFLRSDAILGKTLSLNSSTSSALRATLLKGT